MALEYLSSSWVKEVNCYSKSIPRQLFSSCKTKNTPLLKESIDLLSNIALHDV